MRGFKHFFAVPPVKSAALTIRGIGVQEHMPRSLIHRPQGTGDYLFMMFYDEVWIGAREAPLLHPPVTLMIWTPGTPQHYGHPAQPYNHTWIHCDGTVLAALLARTRLPRNRPFSITDPSLMERPLLAIHTELTTHGAPDTVIVRNLLENWLRETARAIRRRKTGLAVPSAFLEVRRQIELEFAQPLRLAELAARAHLSAPHFCARFKQYFGTPAIDYLIRQRMHQAAYLLRDQNLNISEVGRRVGYEDLFYFSKLFKKHYGRSPRAMRKALGRKPG